MSSFKDIQIRNKSIIKALNSAPSGNPPTGYLYVWFLENVLYVRTSEGITKNFPLSDVVLALNQSTKQTISTSPIFGNLTPGRIVVVNTDGSLTDFPDLIWDSVNKRLLITNSLNVPRTTYDEQGNGIYVNDTLALYFQSYGKVNPNGIALGGHNIFIGFQSGNPTCGHTATAAFNSINNVGIGSLTLRNIAKGSENLAFGDNALRYLTDGAKNTAIGVFAGYSLTTGSRNMLLGLNAGRWLINNSYNTILGAEAGEKTSTGANNTFSERSVLIGFQAKSKHTGSATTNEIAIGDTVVGNGSNTVTLGNDAIERTILKGNIGIGTTAPTKKLHVGGDAGYVSAVDEGTGDTDFASHKFVNDSISAIVSSQTITSSATVTPTGNKRENEVYITAQSEALTIANPSGTAANGNNLLIRIKDDGTARTITWGVNYKAFIQSLPVTTIAGKYRYFGFIYNSQSSTWDLVSVVDEI